VYSSSSGRIALIDLSSGILLSVRTSALSTFSSLASMCHAWPTFLGSTEPTSRSSPSDAYAAVSSTSASASCSAVGRSVSRTVLIACASSATG
jgi:hypothetical protein